MAMRTQSPCYETKFNERSEVKNGNAKMFLSSLNDERQRLSVLFGGLETNYI